MSDRAPSSEQVVALRRLSPAEKLQAALRLYWSARQLKAAGLKASHPEWSDERIEREVRDAFLYHHE